MAKRTGSKAPVPAEAERLRALPGVGAVALSEPSVCVATSAAHRGEAFAGAREIIDRVKAEAPIWKLEVEGGQRRWVEGTEPPSDTT